MKQSLLTFLLISLFCSWSYGQKSPVSLKNTQTVWLMSEAVKDSFLIEAYIPDTPSSLDSLPILVLLDADMTFGMTYDIVRWLNWCQEIPPVALIGFSYGSSEATWWQKRSRDYTVCKDSSNVFGQWPLAGSGGQFIRFIEDELLPFIKDEYKLSCTNRTLIGISFGGLICTNILFAKPSLFKNFIIAGPALQWNNRDVFEQEARYASRNKELNSCVFSAIGSLDYQIITEPWHDFNKIIEERHYSGLVYQTAIIENDTHYSMYPSALTKGLKFILNYH